MIAIYGIYYFLRNKTGYRSDYCTTCCGDVIAEQTRAFDVVHFFWIPLLPAGFWKKWHCSQCGEDPHLAKGMRKGLKLLAGVFSLLLAMIMLIGAPKDSEELKSTLITGLVFLGLSIWAFVSYFRQRHVPGLKDHIAALADYKDDKCIYCQGSMAQRTKTHECFNCGVSRYRPGG